MRPTTGRLVGSDVAAAPVLVRVPVLVEMPVRMVEPARYGRAPVGTAPEDLVVEGAVVEQERGQDVGA
jgi:hypothetical protein